MRATLPSVLSIVALAAVAVLLALSVAACTVQVAPTPNIEEIARAVAGTWAAQTAEVAGGGSGSTPAASGTVAAGTPEPALLATQPPAVTAVPSTMPAAGLTPAAPKTQPPAVSTLAAATPTTPPTATMSPTFSAPCPIVTNPELVPGWDRSTFGCPAGDAAVVWAAWQPFERGGMLWRDDANETYALTWQGTDASRGVARTGGAEWRWDNSFPEGRDLKPPEGLYEPVRGFGYAWFKFLGGPTGNLGWALQPERGFCATLQAFERGFVLRSTTAGPCKDGLFNMARDPSFTPLFLAVSSDGHWRRY